MRDRARASTLDRPSGRGLCCAFTLIGVIAFLGPRAASAETLEVALREQTGADKAAAASQERVVQLHDDTNEMIDKYRRLLTDIDSFKRYNAQLSEQITSQEGEIATINKQLADIEVTARDVLPLMSRMVTLLEEFVKLDVPFLLDERVKRVSTLKEMLPRADVSISEKYRRILEAYQIEMEYGRTLDSYDGNIEDAGGTRTVQFVRLGRVSLMYRTLDGKEAGYWHAEQKGWVRDDSYSKAIRDALRVATKQGAPDLLFAPVPAPKKVAP